MIDFQHVSKNYGGQDVLINVSFRINPGEHVGIVGPNGAGKSTIFGLITGDVPLDGGEVSVPGEMTIGYVRQQLNPHLVDCSLREYAEAAASDCRELERRIDAIHDQLPQTEGTEQAGLLEELGEAQAAFERMGGYDLQHRAEAALCGLGFTADDLKRQFSEFSGGWQMRAELARVLVARSDMLLLDEPSNYLDLPAIEWLKRYLQEFEGTLALVSHDRYLLNELTKVTLEVNGARVTRYAGPCDYYLRERKLRYEQQLAEKKNYDRKRQQIERFIERFRAKNTKASQVQSRITMLEKMEVVEAPPPIHHEGRIRIAEPPHSGVEVLRLEDAGVTYDGERWVLRHVDLAVRRGEKIALVGLNGMGKTTLLRALAGALPLNEGTRTLGHKVAIGYQAQDFAENLPPNETAYEIVKKAGGGRVLDGSVRTLLGSFGFSGEAADKRCAVLSGGEKIRLAFARLLVQPPNVLILDEPTTHLDMAAREALQEALAQYRGTICLVSHDVEFVRHVAEHIIAMTPPGIQRYVGGYDYYKAKIAAEEQEQLVAQTRAQRQAKKEAAKARGKAERHERAQRVQVLARKRKPLQKRMTAAERRLEELNEEQRWLTAQVQTPGPHTDFEEINRRLTAIQGEMEAVTQEWEAAAIALEAVEESGDARQ